MSTEQLSMSMFANRADYDAAVRAHTEQLPEGLQLAVELLEFDRDAFVSFHIHPVSGLTPSDEETATQYLMAIAAVSEEHAQRVTLQHHAADQAQRIADLEAKCDTLKELHDAAADERDALRTKVYDLQRSAVNRREISDGVEAELVDECETLRTLKSMAESERDALRARLAEIDAQEPVAEIKTWHKSREQHADLIDWCDAIENMPDGEHKLYARPATAQAVPTGERQAVSATSESVAGLNSVRRDDETVTFEFSSVGAADSFYARFEPSDGEEVAVLADNNLEVRRG